MTRPFLGRAPRLGADVFVAPTAAVVGDVTLGAGASVWYGASMQIGRLSCRERVLVAM